MVCQIHATRRLRTPDLSLPPTPPSTVGVPLDGQHALHPTWTRMGWTALATHVVDYDGINLTLHLEVTVFLPALMYTRWHQTSKSALDDYENASLEPESCRSEQ